MLGDIFILKGLILSVVQGAKSMKENMVVLLVKPGPCKKDI